MFLIDFIYDFLILNSAHLPPWLALFFYFFSNAGIRFLNWNFEIFVYRLLFCLWFKVLIFFCWFFAYDLRFQFFPVDFLFMSLDANIQLTGTSVRAGFLFHSNETQMGNGGVTGTRGAQCNFLCHQPSRRFRNQKSS